MKKLLTTACLFVVIMVAIISFIASTPFGPTTADAKKLVGPVITGTQVETNASDVASSAKSVLVLTLRSATQTTRCSNATMDAIVFTDKRTATPYSGSVADYFSEN